jgi:cysteine-rich repeat protein
VGSVWQPDIVWGDSQRHTGEGCDDGNTSDGDGWSSTCTIETGWNWAGGSSSSPDTCSEIWGDGKRFNSLSTYCDDGNSISGDGWSSSCTKETGWTWSGGTSSVSDSCTPIWGDSKKIGSEGWDDGNTLNGDGWSNSCTVELGWTCLGGSPTTPDTCTEIWGDGKRFNSVSTYWDDGNTNSNDGWSSICSVEAGWICSGGGSSMPDTCTEIWGDGKKFNSLSTYCDDGNANNNDGWSSLCEVELGWIWSGGDSSTSDSCKEICGDGILYNSENNSWDDGNTQNKDGCSSSWTIEKDWECTHTYGSRSVWTEVKVVSAAVTQAAAGAAMAGSAAASSMSFSSPSGLWQVMNMMQLFMMLVLLGVYLPTPIKDMITSSSYFSLSFEVPFIEQIYGIGSFLTWIDFNNENSTLKSVGVQSGSTFRNVLSQLLTLLLIIMIHLLVIALRKCDPENIYSSWPKWVKYIGQKIFRLFTFAIYIRLLMQYSQFMLISSLSEIYAFNIESTPHLVSLCLACLVLLLLATFFLISARFWYERVTQLNYESDTWFRELFSGLKKTKFGTSYNLLILLRRTYLISWIIWCRSMPLILYLIGATLLQLMHACLIAIIRPFEKVKDNIVEIVNEFLFTVLMGGIVYFHKKSIWSKSSISAYLYLMMFPGLFVFFISICKYPQICKNSLSLGDLAIKLGKFIYFKYWSKKSVQPRRNNIVVSSNQN